jgi:hypothetical protein
MYLNKDLNGKVEAGFRPNEFFGGGLRYFNKLNFNKLHYHCCQYIVCARSHEHFLI